MPQAAVIIRPQGSARTWDVIGADTAAEALSRPVTQPQPVDSSQYIWGGGTAGAVASISFGPPPPALDASQNARLWFFANTGTTTTLQVEVLANGQILGATSVPPGSGFSWQSVTFPPQGLSGAELALRATVLNGGDSNIRDAYLEFSVTGGDGNVDPRVRVVGITDNIRPQDPQTGTSSAVLTAAGNEAASFQVVVTALNDSIGNFTVTADQPLTGPAGSIPASAIHLYRVAYVTTLAETSDDAGPNPTGPWADVLIPAVDPVVGEARNAFPITIPAGQNRIAWVEMIVPSGLAPGDYQGSLAVTGDGLNTRVPVTITVLNFSLPTTSRLASAFFTSLDEACAALHYDIDTQGWQTLAMFIRLGLNNRLTVPTMLRLLRGGGDDERPKFEQTMLPFINGTAPDLQLPSASMTCVRVINGGSSVELAAWRDEANAHDFADRAFVYDASDDNTSCDEIAGHPGRSWNTCRVTYVENVLSTWPQVPVLLTASINDVNNWEANQAPGPLTAIDGAGGRLRLCVLINEMDARSGTYSGDQRGNYDNFLSNANHSLWLYSSCNSWGCTASAHDPDDLGWAGGYVIDTPGSRARSMPWLCYRFNATGELYYDTTASMTTAWQPGGEVNNGGNGAGNLFYPGTPDTDVGDGTTLGGHTSIPLESIRLKRRRKGDEDYHYLTELRDRGAPQTAEQIADQYFPAPFQVPSDDATFAQARADIITALIPLL